MPLTAKRPTQELVNLVGTLGGTWSGFSAMCQCPAHEDRSPSLSLRQGDTGILVHCFAGCDNLAVLRELQRITPGLGYSPPAWREQPKSSNVDRLWDESVPISGTLGQIYLRGRKISFAVPDIRFHPRCPHGRRPTTEFKPALMVAVRDGQRLTAIQRIFIDRSTGLRTEKVMIGSPGQGAWQGGQPNETLGIAEGFEDAAAIMKLGHGPCWTSLGAGRLHLIRIPVTVKTIIIAEDNDSERRRAARRAWTVYREQGFAVRRMRPPEPYGDWAAVSEARAGKEERD